MGPTINSGNLPSLAVKTCDGQFVEYIGTNHLSTTYISQISYGISHEWDIPNFGTGGVNTNVVEVDGQKINDALGPV